MLSRNALLKQARENKYKPDILEKVNKLLLVLEQFMSIPYLKERLVLKGGTALNLFCFEQIPRLSVDIDLNYIGSLERTVMLEERKIIEESIAQILFQNQFERERSPTNHAGGKMIWRYDSALGQKGNLEIDLNYMFRKPLWPVLEIAPKIIFAKSFTVPVLDIHELAAGKLSALFSRRVSRDFFDAHHLFSTRVLEVEKLRTSFVIYASMSDTHINDISLEAIQYDAVDIQNKLYPVLRQMDLPRKKTLIEKWASQLLMELKEGLSTILPFRENEIEFVRSIQEQGHIKPELITENRALTDIILKHPLIQWKANNTIKGLANIN